MFEEALRKIKTALDTLQVAHALIGAYALAFHKVVRATEDLDLLLDCGLSEANSLAKSLSSRGFVSKFVRDTRGDPMDLYDAVHLFQLQAQEEPSRWKKRAAKISKSKALGECLKFLP